MDSKPAYEELEKRIQELEKETFDRKQAEGLLRKRGQKPATRNPKPATRQKGEPHAKNFSN